MSIVRHLIDAAKGKHPITAKRSPHWGTVRDAHLKKHPHCAVCGNTRKQNVHHIQPFHLRPDLELDPSNLITLCESRASMNCHIIFGHCDNWRLINPNVVMDTDKWRHKLKAAHERRKQRQDAHDDD